MKPIGTDVFLAEDCVHHPDFESEHYQGEAPRWCRGCGDWSILNGVKQCLSDLERPEYQVVCVSGIGCSSRFPYYLKTFGFHGIHGRALPLSLGVKLANPELTVITIMGDGDCFSIGAGHWIHAIRYNPDITALVFDNEIYGLTKKQTSPTTPLHTATKTTPNGPYTAPLDPLKLMLGMDQLSFLAQTASWLPQHLAATLKKALEHKGLSFVRILQRCPMFSPQAFGEGGRATEEFCLLRHPNGINVEDPLIPTVEIDPQDRQQALHFLNTESLVPLGLLWQDRSKLVYEETRLGNIQIDDAQTKTVRFEALLDQFKMGSL